jgi:diadenosine tetraphosphate (Ap4A) HIT family hydrolase
MSNSTAAKFGHPRTAIAETDHWIVLVRPTQLTLGSLVLVCKEPATALSGLRAKAFEALHPIITRVEPLLKGFVDYGRINYTALMMVDPDVHFHVFPRYDGERRFEDLSFPDAGWPGPPRFDTGVRLEGEKLDRLTAELKRRWDAQALEEQA